VGTHVLKLNTWATWAPSNLTQKPKSLTRASLFLSFPASHQLAPATGHQLVRPAPPPRAPRAATACPDAATPSAPRRQPVPPPRASARAPPPCRLASSEPDADKAALLAFLSGMGRGATARSHQLAHHPPRLQRRWPRPRLDGGHLQRRWRARRGAAPPGERGKGGKGEQKSPIPPHFDPSSKSPHSVRLNPFDSLMVGFVFFC
jgi:hypothetical protein